MNGSIKEVDWGFTKHTFPDCSHVCCIFDTDEQCQKIASEYLAAGLRQGEAVRYGVDVTTPEQVRSWLLEMGVELPEGTPLNIFKAEDYYCPNGRFEPRKIIEAMPSRFEKAKQVGYSGMRSCGEMTWALKGIPGSDDFLEYEALLNTVIAPLPFSGVCLYDARRFDGITLFNVLRVHPYMVAQWQIVRNPFYVRPEEFLKERASRQA